MKSYEKHIPINITDKTQMLWVCSEWKRGKGHNTLPPTSKQLVGFGDKAAQAMKVKPQKTKDFIFLHSKEQFRATGSMAEPLVYNLIIIVKQH